MLASKTHEINRDVDSVRSQSSLTTKKLDTRVDGALSVMNKVEDQIRVLESGHIKLFNDFRERVQT